MWEELANPISAKMYSARKSVLVLGRGIKISESGSIK